MKHDSRFRVALAFCLFVLFVIGCKSGSSSAPAESGNKTTTTISSGAAPAAPDIAGNYNVVGTNPNGTVYKGTLEVIKQGDVYQFRWKAGTQYDGVGVQNGDVVAVAFASGANGRGCGVVDYVITSDGTLDGKWGYWGVNEAGTERATRLSGSGLEGEYHATGRNPNGQEYKVKISVEADGNLYKFTWSNNSEGIGIRRGENVAIGIGGSRCGFVTYEIKSDGSLDGLWGGYGTNKTGTEKATRQ